MNKIIIGCFFLVTFNQIYAQKNIPQINLKKANGKLINVSKINTNKVTVFIFWATWCVPCIKELDAISEHYDTWKEETKVRIIAVSIDNSRTVSRVMPMVNGKEWEYEILFDTNQKFKRAVNATTIPFSMIAKNNKIVYSRIGYILGSERELYEKIKQFSK